MSGVLPSGRRWRGGWLWWAVGLLAVLWWRLPVAWLVAQAPPLCDGRCALDETAGTPWRGSARLLAVDARGRARPLLPLAWRFDPAALLRGELAWDLAAPAAARLSLDPRGVTLAAASATLNAADLEPLFAGRLALARWSGRLHIDVRALRCDWRGRCAGDVAGQWQALRFGSVYGGVLGDYGGQLSRAAADAPWQGAVKASRGPLWVDLALADAALAGEAWVDAPAQRLLSPLVAGLGRYDAVRERYRFALPLKLDGG